MAKDGYGTVGDQQVTEGGVSALWKQLRAVQRRVVGLGAHRARGWGRRVLSRYEQAHTGKGDLGIWRLRLGRGDDLCRLCRDEVVETGDHLVCECKGIRGFAGWDWRRRVDLDAKSRWAYEYDEHGRLKVGDRVGDFFARLDCELCDVG